MKIGNVISGHQYEEELNRLVRKFENVAAKFSAPRGVVGEIYQAVIRSSEPIGYRAVMEIIGWEATSKKCWTVHTRLNYLADNGWLKRDSRSESGYNTLTHQLYSKGDRASLVALESALSDFNERVEKLEARRMRTACLAVTVRPAMAHIPTRERDILRARLGGMTLAQIGEQQGVSRERIRQIIERDVQECRALEN